MGFGKRGGEEAFTLKRRLDGQGKISPHAALENISKRARGERGAYELRIAVPS